MGRVHVTLVVSITLLLGSWGVAADKASTTRPTTHAQYVEEYHQLLRQAYRDAYLAKGHRDPKWDDATVAALDQLSHFIASKSEYEHGYVFKRDPELYARIDAILKQGSQEPLLRYGVCLLRPSKDDALPGVIDDMQARGYPPALIASPASRLARDLYQAKKVAEADRYSDLAGEHLLKCVNGEGFAAHQQRYLWRELLIFLHADSQASARFVQSLGQSPQADPWLVAMALGMYESRVAYKEKGGPRRVSVDAGQWKRAEEREAAARDYLMTAYELKPQYPEAAAELIRACAGDLHAGNPEERPGTWFDRATAAEFDFPFAYETMLYRLRPRMGGTVEEMYAFGLRCMKTGRYDTLVPYQYVNMVMEIADESRWRGAQGEPDYRFLTQGREIYDRTTEVLRAYIAQPESPVTGQQARSLLFGFAWHCKKYADAKVAYEELNGDLAESAMDNLLPGRVPVALYNEACARSGPAGPSLISADQAIVSSDWATAREHLQKAMDGVGAGGDAAAQAFVRSELATVDLALRLGSDWTSVPIDEHLAGWTPVAGSWRSDGNGGVIGTSTKQGLQLRLNLPLPRGFELSGTCEFLEKRYSGQHGGVLVRQAGHWFDYGFSVYYPEPKLVRVGSGGKPGDYLDKPVVEKTNTFKFAIYENQTRFDWNAKPVVAGQLVRKEDVFGKSLTVALGGQYWYDGTNVRFSDLKLRLTQAPPAAPAP